MKIKAGNVLVGMRVFSPLLGEFFTVKKVQNQGDFVVLREGVFSLKARRDQLIDIKDGE